NPMYMSDYIKHLDNILTSTGEKLLTDAGSVTHKQAEEKAIAEYRKFQVRNLSPVEQAYMESIKTLTAKTSRKNESK
ncbi:MAG: virulence RhuM family protein, partial [Bacteroidales bacterium]|nr:virulence RhuM family protein [Bacteroidales bacterium]